MADINDVAMQLLIDENNALRKINTDIAIKRGMAPHGQVDLVWITRDEMKKFSDYHQGVIGDE